jgi:hypothetical protein
MSLFDEASLIVTPNAFKASKLYSIKPTSGAGDLDVVRATTATDVNSLGLIETVSANVPRLDYSNSTCPSILVEPQRTNLVLRSEEFDNAIWSKSNATIIANSTISPSGVQNADSFIGNGNLNAKYIIQNASIISGTTYSVSVYAKKNTNNFIQLFAGAAAFGINAWANFDLNNGTVGSVGSSASATIESVGNGWYRCIVRATATVTAVNFAHVISLITSATSPANEVNSLSTSVFLWGAQIEVGSNATSYIPTVASSTVTRNADVISKTGISSLIGQTEGTLLLNLNLKAYSSVTSLFTLSDGTSSNRLRSRRTGVNSIELERNLTGQPNKGLTFTSSPSSGLVKVCFTWASTTNGLAIYVNGTKLALNEAIPTFTNQLTQFNLGSLQDGSSSLNDSINLATIWKTKLTDAECIQLTTI